MGKSTENTDFENICDPGPNVEPAVEHLATYDLGCKTRYLQQAAQ